MSVPTVRRRRLGEKLRELRGELTLEELAEKSGGRFVISKLSRMENAKSAIKAADIEALLDLHVTLGREVGDELRSALVKLTKQGDQRGWWHSYRGVLPPAYEDLVSLEADATSIATWQLGLIPGLLQTADYAREIIRATAMSEAVEGKIDALVEIRLARQSVLTREDNPLTLWVIIAESALYTRGRDDTMMREQLGRLLFLGRRANVNIQVLRSTVAPHVGQTGGFSVLSFGDVPEFDVVHTEGLTAALYIEERDKVAVHRDALNRLMSAAESVEASAELIAEIRNKTYEHD